MSSSSSERDHDFHRVERLAEAFVDAGHALHRPVRRSFQRLAEAVKNESDQRHDQQRQQGQTPVQNKGEQDTSARL